METMHAAILDENGALSVRAVPVPELPPYGALVKMRYGLPCYGTDTRLMQKQHPFPVAYPAILGHESVGRVVAVGAKVEHFKIGDLIARVGAPPMPAIGLGVCWGGFAQYGVALDWQAMARDGLPRDQWYKSRVNKVIPDSVDERAAPMIITWRETLSYTNRLGVGRGDNVLIVGSGANALAFVAHCVYAGAGVTVVGNAARNADALRLGARGAIDYKAADAAEQLRQAADAGFAAIIDAVGAPDSVNAALPLVQDNAIVGVYGWHGRSEYGINPFCTDKNFRVYCAGYDEPETHDEVLRRIAGGALDARDWVDLDNPVPLADIAQAYRRVAERKAYKVLIDLT